MFGDRFPMITAHKVLAAYACLAPRVVTGQFDPTRHRAIWPSTGNYARGGIAISRIMASRGVAILPEGMSQERFDWLDRWCENPAEDVIRTFGTESNVKEIYDACNQLAKDPDNFVLNQFCEFGNHLAHCVDHGSGARSRVRARPRRESGATCDWRRSRRPPARRARSPPATGSRSEYGAKIVAVEALECPTMLENGFGEHNIQGIGDKHIPLIHNVTNTDVVCAISDCRHRRARRAVQHASRAASTSAERQGRRRRHARRPRSLRAVVVVQRARGDQDGEAARARPGRRRSSPSPPTAGRCTPASEPRRSPAGTAASSHTDAAEAFGQHLGHVSTDNMIDMTEADRRRIFNLGYYTWVEQQGTPFELFEQRRSQDFWIGLRRYVGVWDAMITDFNDRAAP